MKYWIIYFFTLTKNVACLFLYVYFCFNRNPTLKYKIMCILQLKLQFEFLIFLKNLCWCCCITIFNDVLNFKAMLTNTKYKYSERRCCSFSYKFSYEFLIAFLMLYSYILVVSLLFEQYIFKTGGGGHDLFLWGRKHLIWKGDPKLYCHSVMLIHVCCDISIIEILIFSLVIFVMAMNKIFICFDSQACLWLFAFLLIKKYKRFSAYLYVFVSVHHNKNWSEFNYFDVC